MVKEQGGCCTSVGVRSCPATLTHLLPNENAGPQAQWTSCGWAQNVVDIGLSGCVEAMLSTIYSGKEGLD